MASILYNNILRNAPTLLTDNTAAGYPFANCYDGNTSTQTGFTGASQQVVMDFGTAQTIDALGIARHNLSTTSTTFLLEGSSDNISYSTVTSVTPTSDSVVYKEFTSANYRYYRITVSPTGTLYLSNIFIGQRLDLERSQQGGFIKPTFADMDEVIANYTRGNNLLSITANSRPSNVTFRLDYYTASFFTNWLAVVAAMKEHPVYILWSDTEQAMYCWPARNIPQPRYSNNVTGRYSVTLDMMGFTE